MDSLAMQASKVEHLGGSQRQICVHAAHFLNDLGETTLLNFLAKIHITVGNEVKSTYFLSGTAVQQSATFKRGISI
jgi:hypothetical protein